MGGIVAIGHLARSQNPGIGRLATIGSQVTMPNGQLVIQFLREMLETRTQQLTGRLTGEQLVAETRTSVHNMFFNQNNVAPAVYEALGSWATDVPSVGVMQQYMVLAKEGRLLDARKTFDYSKALGNLNTPMLIACGQQDQFAPPVVQQFLHGHVGSADKTLVVFGQAMGFSVNAGHDDALVGLNSRAEVYPVLDRWLRGEKL